MRTSLFRNECGSIAIMSMVMILALFVVGGAMVVSSVMTTRVASVEHRNIVAYSTAEAGANMILRAFSLYMEDLNQTVAAQKSASELNQALEAMDEDILGLLQFGVLGEPADTSNPVVFHLCPDSESTYFLRYGNASDEFPYVLDTTDGSYFAATITVRPLGNPSSEDHELGTEYLFPFHFAVESIGYEGNQITGRSRISGDGTSNISVITGNYAMMSMAGSPFRTSMLWK